MQRRYYYDFINKNNGEIIRLEETDAAFSDQIDYASLDDLQFNKAISICGDNISVSLSLLIDSSEIKLQYNGKLHKSFRYTNEKPVYIGVFEKDSTVTNRDLEQNNTTRSSYSHMWTGDLHTLRYQIVDYEHIFSATPYVEFSYGDVPYSGEMTFSMILKITESHKYRLAGTTNWTVDTGDYSKCFFIDNVQLTWTAGGNTQITCVQPHVNTVNQGQGSFSIAGLGAAVTGIFPQTATLSTILAGADAILSLNEGAEVTFTNTVRGGTLINTKAYKLKFPEDYYIEESGYGIPSIDAQRFEYNAVMVTTNSNLSQSYWTYAVADFTFRICWADITGQSGSRVYTDYKELGYYNNFCP